MGRYGLRFDTVETTAEIRDGDAVPLSLDTQEGGAAHRFFAHAGLKVVRVEELYRPGFRDVIMEQRIPLP